MRGRFLNNAKRVGYLLFLLKGGGNCSISRFPRYRENNELIVSDQVTTTRFFEVIPIINMISVHEIKHNTSWFLKRPNLLGDRIFPAQEWGKSCFDCFHSTQSKYCSRWKVALSKIKYDSESKTNFLSFIKHNLFHTR